MTGLSRSTVRLERTPALLALLMAALRLRLDTAGPRLDLR